MNYKNPRLYSVKLTMKSGKIISKMLGVAFNTVQRQRLYDQYKSYLYWRSGWNDSTIRDVSFICEKIKPM